MRCSKTCNKLAAFMTQQKTFSPEFLRPTFSSTLPRTVCAVLKKKMETEAPAEERKEELEATV